MGNDQGLICILYVSCKVHGCIFQKFVNLNILHRGFAVVHLVEAQVYKSQGHKFDPGGGTGILYLYNSSGYLWPWGGLSF
jgi:hypothetical protein